MNVRFFASQQAFRKWLEKHHDKENELFVGFYNAQSKRGGLKYKQAVDEALCFGWIDGVRKNLDAESYTNRFSPRKPRSYWSAINTKRFHELDALGLIAPAGRAVFEARDAKRDAKYSFEREKPTFDANLERTFRANNKAWTFWEAQPPGYRRVATWFVMSARRDETRAKRLQRLIEISAKGQRLR